MSVIVATYLIIAENIGMRMTPARKTELKTS